MAKTELVVRDGRISVRSLAVGLVARIGKPKAAQLMTEIGEQIKSPAPSKAVAATTGARSAAPAAKRTLKDIEPVKGVAPQKGQLPSGLVKWLQSRQRQKSAANGSSRRGGRKRQMA